MAVDTRQKRASATHLLVPLVHGAQSDTSGISDQERLAVTWMYSGITVAEAAVVETVRRTLLLLGVGT